MAERMFRNLETLRKKFASDEDFANHLKDITKDKDAIIVSSSKRRESRANNPYWETKVDSDGIRIDKIENGTHPVIWISNRSYLTLNYLDDWYLRIK